MQATSEFTFAHFGGALVTSKWFNQVSSPGGFAIFNYGSTKLSAKLRQQLIQLKLTKMQLFLKGGSWPHASCVLGYCSNIGGVDYLINCPSSFYKVLKPLGILLSKNVFAQGRKYSSERVSDRRFVPKLNFTQAPFENLYQAKIK